MLIVNKTAGFAQQYQLNKNLRVDYMKVSKINIGKAKAAAGLYNKRLSDLGSLNSDEHATSFLKKSQITLASRDSRQEQIIYSARKNSQYNMELALLKLQKQKNCIDELQEYIDELQKDKFEKQAIIEHLMQEKQELLKKVHSNNLINIFVSDKYKNVNELVLMMNQQLDLFQKEKKRWREEMRIKNKQLQSIKELQQTQKKLLKDVYQQKLELLASEWSIKQNKMTQKISTLQNELKRVRSQNNTLNEKSKNLDEFQEILRIRKQIWQLEMVKNKENFRPNFDRNSSQSCKLSDQLASTKAQYIKLQNQTQGIIFQLKYYKRQSQRNSKIIQELRQKLQKQTEERLQRNQDASSYKQSTEAYQKAQLQLKELKRQNKTFVDLLQTTESAKQQNLLKSKQLQRLRLKQEEEIEKISSIFQKINLQ